ncbi:MAG: DoxX family protein [Caldilineaceae bacterium]
MNIVLWIVQILLLVAFGAAGAMKLSQPIDGLAAAMAWVTAMPALVVRFIGLAEVAGALGVVLPQATKIQPKLTAWAGVGLATVMGLATIFHITRGEFGNIVPTLILGALAAFVAWGRWSKA